MKAREGLSGKQLLRFAEAYRCFEQKRWHDARLQCEALMSASAPDCHTLHLLGMIDAREGRLEEAAAHLSQAADLRPEIAWFHQQLANVRQDQGKLDRAIAGYRRAIRLKNDLAEAHNDLGTAYFAKGWLDEALASYRRAVRYDPRNAVAVANMASVLRKKGQLAAARDCLKAELRLRVASTMKGLLGKLTRGSFEASAVPRLARFAERFADQGNLELAESMAREALAANPHDPSASSVLGEAHFAARDFENALDCARRVLASKVPPSYRALLSVAQLFSRLGRVEDALGALRRAVRRDPSNARAWHGLGVILLEKGELAEARKCLERALSLNRWSIEIPSALGRLDLKSGDLESAEKRFNAVLQVEPEHIDALLGLGQTWCTQERLEEAQALYARISRLPLDGVGDWSRLGAGMRQAGMYEQSLKCFEKALQAEPGSFSALTNRGILLTELARPLEAINDLEKALSINSASAEATLDLGRAHYFAEHYEEALRCYEKAMEMRPGWALPWNLKGTWLESQGRFAEAASCYEEVLRREPEDPAAAVNLAHMALVSGDLVRGFELYEARAKLEEFRSLHRRLSVNKWDGAPLEGKSLAVYSEQGLGDEICFASCLPDLMALHPRRVFLTCSVKLEDLFRRSFPGIEVFGGEQKQQTAWLRGLAPVPDLQVAAGSLHRFFRKRMDDFPAHRGYLVADEQKRQHWRKRLDQLGGGLKVGLSWKGGIIRTGELRRTLALEQMLPIVSLGGTQFVSLQYTDCRKDLEQLKSRHGIEVHHWQEAIDDYDETAALVCELDLVISVCTAIVHLGGALGRPVWVMAPIGPHWRYAMQASGMPWYPSIHVFRQQAFGEWNDVLARVRAALAERLAEFVKNGAAA